MQKTYNKMLIKSTQVRLNTTHTDYFVSLDHKLINESASQVTFIIESCNFLITDSTVIDPDIIQTSLEELTIFARVFQIPADAEPGLDLKGLLDQALHHYPLKSWRN